MYSFPCFPPLCFVVDLIPKPHAEAGQALLPWEKGCKEMIIRAIAPPAEAGEVGVR
jgi:hypothetical protein